MADDLAVWLVLFGAGCHTASKNWAFWRLLTLNQFSLVTGMGLTAAAAAAAAVCVYVCVCVHKCVPLMCMFCVHAHICAYVKKWESKLKRERERERDRESCVCLCFPSSLCKCGLAQNPLFNLAAILLSGVYGSSLSPSWQSEQLNFPEWLP